MTDRPQVAGVGGATSSFEMIGTRVAQGSILRAMLFNLYINNIMKLRNYLIISCTRIIQSNDMDNLISLNLS